MSDNNETKAPEKVEEKKVLSRADEINVELTELSKKYLKSRSVLEQADLTSKMGALRKELKEHENAKPVVDVYQKEVPVRADHVEEKDKTRVPYEPQGDGKTFITTL